MNEAKRHLLHALWVRERAHRATERPKVAGLNGAARTAAERVGLEWDAERLWGPRIRDFYPPGAEAGTRAKTRRALAALARAGQVRLGPPLVRASRVKLTATGRQAAADLDQGAGLASAAGTAVGDVSFSTAPEGG
jgi:hypothetical protein